MDLFLDSLTKETESFVQSSIQAERSHLKLQGEYFDIENMAKQKLIQSSRPSPIPKKKSAAISASINQSKMQSTLAIKANSRSKTTIRKKHPNDFSSNRKISSHLNNPIKQPKENQTKSTNSNNNDVEPTNNPSSFLIQTKSPLNNSSPKHQSQRFETKSITKNNLLFSHKPTSNLSARAIVPSHPFIISSAMGGEGFDTQDSHFTNIPQTQPERNTGLRNQGSPFFARVFSERFNPNIPIDSELRCRPKGVIDPDVDIF